MRCEDIMKRDVECIDPTQPVQEAARRMRDANVGFLPVCDSSKKVLGAITDRDIAIRIVAEGRPPTTTAADVMTRKSSLAVPTTTSRTRSSSWESARSRA